MPIPMDKPIRVRVLGREFALRVREDDEATMRDIAAFVDVRMQAFRNAHPDQPELTASIIVALGIAEELFALRDRNQDAGALDDVLDALSDVLDAALVDGTDGVSAA
jgi:cell division protein ZapA